MPQKPERHQRVVQFVRIARVRTSFLANAIDRRWIECPQPIALLINASPCLHGVAPPLLERRIVQERVGRGAKDLVGKRRWLRRVPSDEGQLAAMDAAEHLVESGEVHGLFEAVANRLRHERMVGNLPIARDVLEAGRCVGKDRGEQVRREHD